MKKIVAFAPGISETGGAAKRSRLLFGALVDRGWTVTVVARAGTLLRPRISRNSRLTIVEVPGFNLRRIGAILFLAVAIPIGLIAGARASGFVAIQLLSQTTAAAICARILRKPFVALSTTGGNVSELDDLLSGRWPEARRRIVASAAFVVAQTPHAGDDIARIVPKEKIRVLPTPAAVPDDVPVLTGKPRAMFSGRFSEEKDLLRLLDAWERIVRAVDGAELTLVGAGGRYRSVEAQVRAKVKESPVLARSVHLPGWVDDVATHLRGHDVFVLPSLSEGMSNALLEAGAYGRVIVASDIPANRAVLGDEFPLLFRAGDDADMERALIAALTDRATREDAVRAVTSVMPAFSIDEIARRLEEMIVDAADHSRN